MGTTGRGGRRNQTSNALASAFKDAWKQGNLASDVINIILIIGHLYMYMYVHVHVHCNHENVMPILVNLIILNY